MITHPIGRFEPDGSPLTPDRRSELIARLTSSPARLREVLARLGAQHLDAPYRDGGWTPRQIVHHLADSHLIGLCRIKRALTEDEPEVFTYDPDAWVAQADVDGAPTDLSLQILDVVHERMGRLFEAMSPEQYGRRLHYSTRGTVDLDFMLQLYSWHGNHHRAQIEALADRSAGG